MSKRRKRKEKRLQNLSLVGKLAANWFKAVYYFQLCTNELGILADLRELIGFFNNFS